MRKRNRQELGYAKFSEQLRENEQELEMREKKKKGKDCKEDTRDSPRE